MRRNAQTEKKKNNRENNHNKRKNNRRITTTGRTTGRTTPATTSTGITTAATVAASTAAASTASVANTAACDGMSCDRSHVELDDGVTTELTAVMTSDSSGPKLFVFPLKDAPQNDPKLINKYK